MKRVLALALVPAFAAACDSPSGSSSGSVAEVVLSAPTQSVSVGGTVQLTAQARSASGQVVSGATVSWSSLAPTVASVSGTGLATGLSAGSARIVASSGGRADTVTLTVVAPAADCTAANAVSLAVGGVHRVTGAAAGSVCLSGGAGVEYTLVPFFQSDNGSATVSLQFQGTGLAAAAGPPSPSVAPALSLSAGTGLGRVARQASDDGGFHVRLRERTRPVLAPMVPAARAAFERRRSGARFDVTAGAVPAVGSLITLNANSSSACSNPDYRTARVQAVGQRAIIVADTLNPSGGLAAEDYAHISATVDTLLWPVVTGAFGAPADLDVNERMIIFYTRAVNDLTPANSGFVVGGFFWARDLFPKTAQPGFDACPASNAGEMFYMLAADPSGEVNGNVRSREYIVEQTLGTVAHEMQHLISASRRLYVIGTANYDEDIWLNEGLSHIAEELLFYRGSGFEARQNIGVDDLRESQRRVDAYNAYGRQNLGRFASYLASPETWSPFMDDDDLAVRGSAWSFLRYAADRRAGDDQQLWFDLVNNTRTGIDNLQHHLGVDPRVWARDWNVANYADDAVTGIAPQYRHPSWNFRSIYEFVTNNNRYPLATRSFTGAAQTVSLRAAGASYLRTAVPAGTGAVQVTSGGAAPPASVSLSIVRTK